MHVVVVLTITTRANKNETGSHAQSRAFTKTAIGGKANGSLPISGAAFASHFQNFR
jgi:hypothetical protein